MISKAKLKYLSALKQKKIRDQRQAFLIEGLRLCEEALDSDYEIETALICRATAAAQSNRAEKLLAAFRARQITTVDISLSELREISETVHSQGIVCVVKKRAFDRNEFLKNQPDLLLALDAINDPGNLGVIIRTANWFGVKGIFLSSHAVEATNPKVVRASMGGFFHLPLFENCDLEKVLANLQKENYAIWVADAAGDVDYRRAAFGKKNVLVLGSETAGAARPIKTLASGRLRIPKRGKAESLNVGTAAAILLAELTKEAL